jgi:hypothetical protein
MSKLQKKDKKNKLSINNNKEFFVQLYIGPN